MLFIEPWHRYTINLISFKRLVSSKSQIITLTFEYMDIEPSFRCMADYVVVHGPWADYVGKPPPTPYCGTSPPQAPIQAETDEIYVTFVSNDNLVYRGFLAKYEITPPPCEYDV